MPLSLNDIRDRAFTFAREWASAESEDAEAKSFWDAFFEVFGVPRRRVATFEKRVKKIDGKDGYIDLLWKGNLLIEHKSRGKDLARAHKQATDYFDGLSDSDLPKYILVSDFARFRLYDLEEGNVHEFALKDLHKNIHLFGFIAGYRKQKIREQDPINVEAVQKMGDLHDLLKRDGYAGHPLEVFLVRLLFCFFADDTGIFQPRESFRDLLENFTSEDGANVGDTLSRLFITLNLREEDRQKSLAEHFKQFPYVDGRLFEERLTTPAFNRQMRDMLIKLCGLDWGRISPAIFGAMFQSVIELDAKDRRRQLGAHYTSETNILRLIGPLFLDDLRAEFEKSKNNKNQLFEFHKKLNRLVFLDPACGCGNFLVITYRELRHLELETLRAAEKFGARIGGVFQALKVDVDQFYGIEVEEFPAQVAQVAMWLTDHQMNIEASEVFGEPILRIPLQKSANIRLGNALRIDWAEFVPPNRLNYILGNPPFGGAMVVTKEQREDMLTVAPDVKGIGVLDYVAGWYLKAADYASATPDGFSGVISRASKDRKKFTDVRFGKGEGALSDLFADAADVEVGSRRGVKCAFVSTNSITQGEQVGILWSELFRRGVKIHFAHQTFQWMNEAPGKAAVHCVIIGFAAHEPSKRRLFEYADLKGEPHEVSVANVNPYLLDGPDVLLPNRDSPISPVPSMRFGNMPRDDGNLLLTSEEREDLLATEPQMAPWIKLFLGAHEFLNGELRYCLWLEGVPATTLAASPKTLARIKRVNEFRAASKAASTRKFAETPALFCQIAQPKGRYVLVPRHSSENRSYIPLGFFGQENIVSDSCMSVPDATVMHFGVLSSAMHMAWVRYTCGRLKNDYRYSKDIVYNNFPWPAVVDLQSCTDASSIGLRKAIEDAAQSVLESREAEFKRDASANLATLYNPETTPRTLFKAHQALDRAVDRAYVRDGGRMKWANDAERMVFLFQRYHVLTGLLLGSEEPSSQELVGRSRRADRPSAQKLIGPSSKIATTTRRD